MINPDHIDDFRQLQKEFLDSFQKIYPSVEITHPSMKTLQPFHGAVSGAIKLGDALWIAEALEYTKPKNILEIGSNLGFSTRWMLDRSLAWSPKLTAIDPSISHTLWMVDRLPTGSPKLTTIDPSISRRISVTKHNHLKAFCAKYNDRLKIIDAFFSFSFEQDQHLSTPVITEPFDKFDCAFIDGNHRFESALCDIVLAARMMPQGGLILVHDTNDYPAIAPAIETIAQATSDIEYYVASHLSKISGYNPLEYINYIPHFKDIKSGFLPLSIDSIRKWNHKRRIRRHMRFKFLNIFNSLKILSINGVGVIKVKDGSKLDTLDLDSLLAKKDEMLPKKDEILKKRRLPNDDLTAQLKRWGYR